ncbi:hypothetical protein [Microbacterium amylolyticum]|uniref:DUF2178 domain-containing protein n=1 Tax=Microbacterium amylolyticum TaxID=936337 RepID=A0ABS4ZK26_9MICO|nr:hypothetical protein [Microbacterium amylolyticum]MBP2437650.1 hypothetical protein [Microbacterium amylolyticum]
MKAIRFIFFPLAAATGITFVVFGHVIPGMAIIAATALLAVFAGVFIPRNAEPTSALDARRQKNTRIGLVIGASLTVVGIALTALAPGFFSYVSLMSGISMTGGYVLAFVVFARDTAS